VRAQRCALASSRLTENGRAHNSSNVRNRVLAKSVERANADQAKRDLNSLPEGLTPHSLRRTFISLLLAIGEEVPYVMRQVGHTDPKVTLAIYAQEMSRDDGERERLRALIEGTDWALLGSGTRSEASVPGEQLALGAAGSSADAGTSADGRGWFRTSDLSRVKRGRWWIHNQARQPAANLPCKPRSCSANL